MSNSSTNIIKQAEQPCLPWECKKHIFSFNEITIQILIPDNNVLQHHYQSKKESDISMLYWARLWPASVALCRFIAYNSHLIKDKKVAEIAAGLGLPSLLTAHYAKEVYCSDYNADAVSLIKQSIVLNGLENIYSSIIDWNHIPTNFNPEVLLLSDINYAPEEFDRLQNLLVELLNKGTIIILSTPQRLVAKEFILPLLSYCKQQESYTIETDKSTTDTTVFVLMY